MFTPKPIASTIEYDNLTRVINENFQLLALNLKQLNDFINTVSNKNTNHGEIALNTIHRTSVGSDHGFIDQAVTEAASPEFAGLTVDNRDVLRYAILQG